MERNSEPSCPTGATILTDAGVPPLRFDRTHYTPFEEFLRRLEQLPAKPKRVHNYALAVQGRVANDRMATYLAAPGESPSLLREALKSPRHYLMARNEEVKPRKTRHFELGAFARQAILDPARFDRVVVRPSANRSQRSGCAALIACYCDLLGIPRQEVAPTWKIGTLQGMVADLEAQCARSGCTVIDRAFHDAIRAMRASFRTYGGGILPRLMQYVKTQTSLYGKDPATGLKVKIRPDGLLLAENWGLNAVLSVRTTSAPCVEAFLRDCAKFRRELAEGMALRVASRITGRRFSAAVTVMVQTVLPYQVALFYWDAEDLEIGQCKYAQALDIVRACREADHWPGFDAQAAADAHGILRGKLPAYIRSEVLPRYLPDQGAKAATGRHNR
ncbi:hypothetical protein [Alistipes sp.]|uniref:hypothetical protein n=1 Tax=Alistipes sp. TaxID=1872444 RepID=UPI003AF11065